MFPEVVAQAFWEVLVYGLIPTMLQGRHGPAISQAEKQIWRRDTPGHASSGSRVYTGFQGCWFSWRVLHRQDWSKPVITADQLNLQPVENLWSLPRKITGGVLGSLVCVFQCIHITIYFFPLLKKPTKSYSEVHTACSCEPLTVLSAFLSYEVALCWWGRECG